MARFNSVAIHLWSLIWLISYVIADLENSHHTIRTVVADYQEELSKSLKVSGAEIDDILEPGTLRSPTGFVYQLCRDKNSTAPIGNIQPYNNATAEVEYQCDFSIIAPIDQRIEISCSAVNWTNFASSLRLDGVIDIGVWRPIANRVYISVSNQINLISRLRKTDGFDCKWTVIPSTSLKLCRDWSSTATNGVIQPFLDNINGESRYCYFNLIAPLDHQIQLSCSALNLINPSSFLRLEYIVDVNMKKPALNRIYTSTDRALRLESRVDNSDWFHCNWTIRPKIKTTEFKLCRDGEARQILNGTIRPLMATDAGSTGESRFCSFKIYAPENQSIRMSCSSMNFTSSGNDNINVQYSNSTYKFLRLEDTVDVNVSPPVLNRVYTSIQSQMTLYSRVGVADWFVCKWTTTSLTA
uniref:CUB domain-containing protein n=1 Tax=Daphnia galeata TaxID=27404 RepID=A0A8J2RIS0_9CRUS|nr:unnamed protein product [Daphnia galeata]